MKFDKKGQVNGLLGFALVVLAVLGILALTGNLGGVSQYVPIQTPSTPSTSMASFGIQVSNLSNGTLISDNSKAQVIRLESADLAVAEDITFDLTVMRTDGTVLPEGDSAVAQISCKPVRERWDAWNSTDSVRVLGYSSSTGFNINVDGVSYKNLPARRVITHIAPATVPVSINVVSASVLAEVVEDMYQTIDLAQCTVGDNKVTLQYIKTA